MTKTWRTIKTLHKGNQNNGFTYYTTGTGFGVFVHNDVASAIDDTCVLEDGVWVKHNYVLQPGSTFTWAMYVFLSNTSHSANKVHIGPNNTLYLEYDNEDEAERSKSYLNTFINKTLVNVCLNGYFNGLQVLL